MFTSRSFICPLDSNDRQTIIFTISLCSHRGLSFDPSDSDDIFASRSRRIFPCVTQILVKNVDCWGNLRYHFRFLNLLNFLEFLSILDILGATDFPALTSRSFCHPCQLVFLSSCFGKRWTSFLNCTSTQRKRWAPMAVDTNSEDVPFLLEPRL